MRRFAFLALLLASSLSAATTKEIQKLEKTLAGDRDANPRAEAAWQLGQVGSMDSVPALIKALESDGRVGKVRKF